MICVLDHNTFPTPVIPILSAGCSCFVPILHLTFNSAELHRTSRNFTTRHQLKNPPLQNQEPTKKTFFIVSILDHVL